MGDQLQRKKKKRASKNAGRKKGGRALSIKGEKSSREGPFRIDGARYPHQRGRVSTKLHRRGKSERASGRGKKTARHLESPGIQGVFNLSLRRTYQKRKTCKTETSGNEPVCPWGGKRIIRKKVRLQLRARGLRPNLETVLPREKENDRREGTAPTDQRHPEEKKRPTVVPTFEEFHNNS